MKQKIECNTVQPCKPWFTKLYCRIICPVYNTPGFLDIASIEMVYYGFEQYKESNEGVYMYTCQHGPNERLDQRIESCGIDLEQYSAVAYILFIPFIMNLEIKLNVAIMKLLIVIPLQYAQTVANDLDMNWDAINACFDSIQKTILLCIKHSLLSNYHLNCLYYVQMTSKQLKEVVLSDDEQLDNPIEEDEEAILLVDPKDVNVDNTVTTTVQKTQPTEENKSNEHNNFR
ncbi:hypothetical protein RFI_34469 [Reticulomyxa filosa]|uniref:Uncharacterized protein n=1 Tax=Reticulomyxa filosa TaxID=46433 RepID=X6LNK8_RETFI|nr:hypothetical protein RFI_34469 [Reticulomyxa filosa]|eukprot:ETO02941.1 hypothetical protein RFI_34469 [Reticulomyxa filosa]